MTVLPSYRSADISSHIRSHRKLAIQARKQRTELRAFEAQRELVRSAACGQFIIDNAGGCRKGIALRRDSDTCPIPSGKTVGQPVNRRKVEPFDPRIARIHWRKTAHVIDAVESDPLVSDRLPEGVVGVGYDIIIYALRQ